MGFIGTIIIGFLAGVVARFLIPGKTRPGGIIMTTIVGILGALLATYLGGLLGVYEVDEAAGFIGAVVGSIILLLIYGKVTKG
ncbi:GlsB/YeaQ/YmgE family stress response membrane protein [Litorimonas haliclonae]|uniref:GlsB/YeaQ/YmgE family stress response membrane protein n=1 Tax=Litorimonas haliclonae TaxID=2081977 RepID=UPI0039EFA66B